MIQTLCSRCLRLEALCHQKYTVVLRLFSVMLRLFLLIFFIFCYFLLLFLLFVTFSNYFLLLKVQCLLLFLLLVTFINYFFYCWEEPGESFSYISSLFRGRGCAYTYDPGITLVMPKAWGPLTTKNKQWCWGLLV